MEGTTTVVHLAGMVAVDRGGQTADLAGRATRRVLAVLALERHPVTQDRLAEAVWGDELPRSWPTAVRGAVHRIRRAGGEEIVRTSFGCYQLHPGIAVDVLDAARQVAEAEAALRDGEAPRAADLAGQAWAILELPLMPGEDGEWFDRRRAELSELALRAAMVDSSAATAAGDHARAIAAASAAVQRSSYDEAPYRRLMAAHAAAGNRAEALAAYRSCRSMLTEELGVDPSPATESVYVSLLGEEPLLPEPVAPVEVPSTLDRPTPLCGRDQTMTELGRHLDVVLGGGHRLVALVGSAGVGKSRLAAEIGVLAHELGASVVHGRFDADEMTPLGALTQALGQLGVAWPAPRAADMTGATSDRDQLFADAADAIAALTATRPLIVVLDDLHWADRASVALLERLCGTGGADRLLVVATVRSDVHNPAVANLLDRGSSHATVVRVDALDRAATGALIAQWAGHTADPVLADQVFQRTQGNPFFIAAVLQSLGAGGRFALGAGLSEGSDVPSIQATHVGQVIRDLIDSVDRIATEVLQVAAVVGAEFRVDVVTRATRLASERVLVALDRAARARLVGQSALDPGRFQFTHDLVREAVLNNLEKDRRQQVHRAIAAVIEEAPVAEVGQLVRHFLASGDQQGIVSAARASVDLAVELVERGGPERARDLLVEVLGRIEGGDTDAAAEQCMVMAALAGVELGMQDIPVARDHLRRAARRCVELRMPELIMPISLGIRAPDVGEVDDEMIGMIESLLSLTGADSTMRAYLLIWLASELGWSEEPERAVAAAAEALRIARESDDRVLLRGALPAWHYASRATARPEERRAAVEEALAAERSRPAAARLLAFLTVDALELGDLATSHWAMKEALDLTSGMEASFIRFMALRTEVMLTTMDGRLDEAERLGEALTARMSLAASGDTHLIIALQTLARRYHQGRLAELHPLIAAVAGIQDRLPILTCVLAWIETELCLDSATATTDAAITAIATLPRNVTWIPSVALTIEAASGVTDPRAADLADLLTPWSGYHVVTATVAYLGAVDRYLALGAASAGDLDRAIDLGHAALEQHRSIGSVPYLARTAAELAYLHDQRGRPSDRRLGDVLRDEARVLSGDHGLARVAGLLTRTRP